MGSVGAAGVINSRLTDQPAKTYSQAMIKVIDGLTLENSSQPINFDGSVLPW